MVADAAWEDRKANTGFSPGPELPTTPAVEPSAGRRPPREGLSLPPPATLLAAFWLAGVGLVVGWKTWRRWRFARLLGRCGRVDSPACERIAARLGERLRLRRHVGLIVTERLVGPAVFGLLRPTVLMPQTVIEGKPAKELELMLAHELIHVRRGDLWFAALRSAVEALWWFHPPVWWAGRRAAREAERCCDEAVLAELQCGPGATPAACWTFWKRNIIFARRRRVPACGRSRSLKEDWRESCGSDREVIGVLRGGVGRSRSRPRRLRCRGRPSPSRPIRRRPCRRGSLRQKKGLSSPRW